MRGYTPCLLALALFAAAVAHAADEKPAPQPPAIGEVAPDFTLANLKGEKVTLSAIADQGPVVLVVLRGYPGYQCPICSRQVGDLHVHAPLLKEHGARVLLVYPGPADHLDEKAVEFLGKRSLPEGFELVIDPDYTFTNLYHLRWDAPRETAYPATFVLDAARKVHFAKVSKTHAGRTNAKEVLEALEKMKADKS